MNRRHIILFLLVLLAWPAIAAASVPDTLSVGGGVSARADAGCGMRDAGSVIVTSAGSSAASVKDGRVTVTSGRSVTFLPGTKITAGSFLYASIEPPVKQAKHRKKAVRLVTLEEKEKIEGQADLARACAMFSPFPAVKRGNVHAGGDSGGSSYDPSVTHAAAVSPEQQRKVVLADSPQRGLTIQKIRSTYHPAPAFLSFRAETTAVLRL